MFFCIKRSNIKIHRKVPSQTSRRHAIKSHHHASHHPSSCNPYTQLPTPPHYQKIQPKQQQTTEITIRLRIESKFPTLFSSWSGPLCITSATQPDDIAMRCACACGCDASPSSPTSICAYFPALRDKRRFRVLNSGFPVTG